MRDLRESCRIAVVQAAPVMFDKAACTVKAVELIRAAAAEQAELIVFPELFIPGYPYGMTFGFTVGSRTAPGRKDWGLYYDNSILVPGPETEILGRAAREARAYVSIGVSERDAVNATLICWESYMPLARVALYEKGITLYLSPNTNDNEEWQATIRHIAIEGHCFFVNCDMVFTRDMYPAGLHCPEEIGRLPDIVCRGGSCVVDPYGHYVTQPVWDREAIICADLDLTQVPRSRMEFDGCGHYARPDVLKLTVDDR